MAFTQQACKKKSYEESQSDTPVYSVRGLINGIPVEMIAGQNNQVFSAVNQTDHFGYLEYTASFVNSICDSCDPSISITLNEDFRVGDSIDYTGPVLEAGTLPFQLNTPEAMGLAYRFFAENAEGFRCEWSIENMSPENVNTVNHNFASPGINTVSLYLHRNDEIEYMISTSIQAGSDYSIAVPFEIEWHDEEEWKVSYPDQIPEGLVIQDWVLDGNSSYGTEMTFTPEQGRSIQLNYYNTITKSSGFYKVDILDNFCPILPAKLSSYFKGLESKIQSVRIEYRDAHGNLFHSTHLGNANHLLTMERMGTTVYGTASLPAQKIKMFLNADLISALDTTLKLELRQFEIQAAFLAP
jgi:hypothetical protein